MNLWEAIVKTVVEERKCPHVMNKLLKFLSDLREFHILNIKKDHSLIGKRIRTKIFTKSSYSYGRSYDVKSIVIQIVYVINWTTRMWLTNTGFLDDVILNFVQLSFSRVIKTVKDFGITGMTALGPALTVCVSMVQDCPYSEVVLCTDGMANVGLGAVESNRQGSEHIYDKVRILPTKPE